MQAQLNKILEEAKAQLNEASTLAQTDDIRVKILGKKGKLTEILRGKKNYRSDGKQGQSRS